MSRWENGEIGNHRAKMTLARVYGAWRVGATTRRGQNGGEWVDRPSIDSPHASLPRSNAALSLLSVCPSAICLLAYPCSLSLSRRCLPSGGFHACGPWATAGRPSSLPSSLPLRGRRTAARRHCSVTLTEMPNRVTQSSASTRDDKDSRGLSGGG